ncbi:MAG TPA: hypothetical protein VKT32_16995 [Chthonomonadaceae bacterium]|nr:hypothetical protein [Chthonomonadaceae bacterium]
MQITLRDFIVLERLLAAKPHVVLEHFAACQIRCLAELRMWERFKAEQPQAAARIALVAAAMGIAEN